MRQSGSHIPSGTFLAGKFKQAEDKKDKLLDVINRLAQLSYEKGTRHSDHVIRERVKALTGEVGQQYGKIRSFSSGKVGDAFAFEDILAYFNRQYLERFLIRELLDEVRREFAGLDSLDRDFEEKNPDTAHRRKVNVYRQNLEREMKEWEKLLLVQVEPLLRGFLTDLNDIVLFNRLEERIDRLVTSDDVFVRIGQIYQEFKDCLAYYEAMHIKLARLPLTDAELVDSINRTLQLMGFRNPIMRARNINPDIYAEIMGEVLAGGNLRELVKQYSDTSRDALEAIRSREKKEEKTFTGQDLQKVLEGPHLPRGHRPA